MSREFQAFQVFKDKEKNAISNKKLIDVIKEYSYLYLTDSIDLKISIDQNLTDSSVIMINYYRDHSTKNDELHFIIVFRKTVLIIKRSLLPNLQPFFHKKDKLKICFFEDTKNIFEEIIKIEYEESKKNEFFEKEISAISKEFFNYGQFQYKKFLNSIKSCISGYLIQQSYCDLNYDRIEDFYTTSKKEIIPRKMNENELIELRMIGAGSSFQTVLYYHVYDERLYVIKNPNVYDPEIEKLLKREQSNYTKIKHPFIPKYYGTINIDENICLVIEFINGQALSSINCSLFSISDKIKIILQMLSVIKYLHENNFIYRDLKPSNVIINENQTLVVVDFDRMIEDKNINNENDNPPTKDFINEFQAPEINDKNVTNKCDIYSIGKMINKIIPDIENNKYYSMIYPYYHHCIDKSQSNRPSISDLLCFILIFIENKNISLNFSLDFYKNDPQVQNNLGLIYKEGQYISRDINKSIYYLSLAANQNYLGAQFNLGLIYYSGRYISRDINKSIYYFEKVANQNDPEAQYILGMIYYSDQYISRDINKSIYYLSLAANQNYPEAQSQLGLIYYLGRYVSRDINKSIYYFEKVANQNDPEAQYNLGLIYYSGGYISRDINKAIYYFEKAANQNYPQAQFILGLIYYSGGDISRDINKSIYYYEKAANQNYPQAQFILGIFYKEGQYIPRDINKSIYYYEKAANQNFPQAQYNLGVIYSKGQYIPRDINKSIYYFEKAANQNFPQAQYNLGVIYSKGQYIPRDINKSIYYFEKAANQNIQQAQFILGIFYEKGQYIPQDINKSIYYFEKAANQNHIEAQFNLGAFYFEGKYISRDINKSIHYFQLAANQNHPQAQYVLGFNYYEGLYIKQDIKRGIYWITQSSKNNCIEAHFALGFLYQEGKCMKRNIEESIKYYKKASSFNNQYAKNNLGIIYKNYIEKKYDYTVYFEEAIRQKNDPVSMYNLSHSYIYEYQNEELINKSVELLIKSSNLGFKPSLELLCITILKIYFNKHTNCNELIDLSNIEQELSKFTKEIDELKYLIIDIIQKQQLYDQTIFESYYQKYKKIEFIYDLFFASVCILDLYNEENELKLEESNEKFNITINFYEGFGHDMKISIV